MNKKNLSKFSWICFAILICFIIVLIIKVYEYKNTIFALEKAIGEKQNYFEDNASHDNSLIDKPYNSEIENSGRVTSELIDISLPDDKQTEETVPSSESEVNSIDDNFEVNMPEETIIPFDSDFDRLIAENPIDKTLK